MRHRTRTTREKSPWAVFSVLVVITAFGMFWLWQKQQIVDSIPEQQLYAPRPAKSVSSTPIPSMNDLEANAANITVPSFESVL